MDMGMKEVEDSAVFNFALVATFLDCRLPRMQPQKG